MSFKRPYATQFRKSKNSLPVAIGEVNKSGTKVKYGSFFINMVTDTHLTATSEVYISENDIVRMTNGRDYRVEKIIDDENILVMPVNL